MQHRVIGDMIRIGADKGLIARDVIVGEPIRNARELRLAIAIVTRQPRVDMIGAVGLVEPRREHVVDPQPPRDRIDIEMERRRREQQPVSRLAVGGDLVERRRVQPGPHHLVGIAFGERRDLVAAKPFADEQAQVDRFQPRPIDQPQRIGRARQRDERQQQQAPLLPPAYNMHQEATVSP